MITRSSGYLARQIATTHWFLHLEDPLQAWLFGGVLGILVLASTIGAVLQQTAKSDTARATIDNLNARMRAWWKMCAIFALTLLIGRIGSLVLFALLSLLALREYVTLIPTRRQRSSNAGLELLRHYAVAVLPGRNPLVWVLRDHGSGSGVPFHSHADGDDRRHRAFPGARRENPVRNHDLFVLLESRSSIAHPEDSRIRGP